ncbi:MAG: hypothetical protein VX104_04525 [Planctomycetota bacterium]|nr:hypothetical protein [Planctomycetota bacterium]
MAVRGGSNIGLIISNIMFALAFITALVLVINVDAKKEEARQEAQAAKANLVAAIGPGVIEQAPGYDAAQMNNQSVVAQLSGQIDTLKRLIGTTTADEQRIRTDLGFESGSILEIKGRMENQLGALTSDREELANRVAEQDATIEALRDELDVLGEQHQKSLARVSKDVEIYRAQADSYGQDVDRTIKTLKDSRAALEQNHNAKRRRLQEDIDTKGRENQVLTERVQQLEAAYAENRLRSITPELLVDGQIVETEPKTGSVYIDRGVKDRLVLGMRFQVFDSAEAITVSEDGKTTSGAKATIEVVRVGANTSTGKILTSVSGRPIQRGDALVNAVYDPERRYSFMVHGIFDVDQDGNATEAEANYLRSRISAWGGDVIEGDTLPGDIDFLVLGEQPIRPLMLGRNDTSAESALRYQQQRSVFDTYEELFEQATRASIPVLNANRFFLLIGQTDR